MTARFRKSPIARNNRDHPRFTAWFETGFYISLPRRAAGFRLAASHIRRVRIPPKWRCPSRQPFERNRLQSRRLGGYLDVGDPPDRR